MPGDPLYATRENRRYLNRRGLRFAGKPLGRPKKVTKANQEELKRLKAQRREEYLHRIPIEGKFGQVKNGYRLNYIRAKLPKTSAVWINSIFLVMNLLILLRAFFALCRQRAVQATAVIGAIIQQIIARTQSPVDRWGDFGFRWQQTFAETLRKQRSTLLQIRQPNR